MKMCFSASVAGLAFVLAMAVSGTAQAATVSCVGTGRTFTIDTTPVSTCAAVAPLGADNISGEDNGANQDPLFALLGPGLILIDKSDSATAGTNPTAMSGAGNDFVGLAGSFSFNPLALVASAGKEYFNFVIAFKSGGNNNNSSVWAAFDLADGVSSGTWSMTGQNNLSHANLYAYERDVAPIPVPAAGLLLASALGGIAVLRRRKARA